MVVPARGGESGTESSFAGDSFTSQRLWVERRILLDQPRLLTGPLDRWSRGLSVRPNITSVRVRGLVAVLPGLAGVQQALNHRPARTPSGIRINSALTIVVLDDEGNREVPAFSESQGFPERPLVRCPVSLETMHVLGSSPELDGKSFPRSNGARSSDDR